MPAGDWLIVGIVAIVCGWRTAVGGSVALTRLFVSTMGPRSGAGLHARLISGLAVRPRPGGVDAVFDFNPAIQLGGRSTVVLPVIIRTGPTGCMATGSTSHFSDMPTVTVEALGWSTQRSVRDVGNGFGFHGTRASSCNGNGERGAET